MKFYDTGNPYNSAVHYVNYLLGLASGDITYFPLADKARSFNTNKHLLALMMYKYSSAWEADDNANTDLPIFTAPLVAGQRDYTLPTAALALERVEVKDAAGNYYRLNPMDESDRPGALTNYGESNGTPENYWIRGRSLFVDPAPASGSVTLAAGLKIYVERSLNEFTPGTTTTDVGFDEPGDRTLCYMVAEEHAATHPEYSDRLPNIRLKLYGGVENGKEIAGLLDGIIGQNLRKLKDMKPGIRIVQEDME